MKRSYKHAVFSTRSVLLLLVGSLVLASCATTPWYLRASDHFGKTFRTRTLGNNSDVFFGPNFNLYGTFDLESVWVGLQKEAELPHLQLRVQTTLSEGGGNPFQQAHAGTNPLDFLSVSLKTHDAMKQDLTSVEMTVQRFVVRIPVSLASTAACDTEDFEIELSGDKKENFDLVLPRAMLQGFLGKVKKSGEEGIEGECFDQFL